MPSMRNQGGKGKQDPAHGPLRGGEVDDNTPLLMIHLIREGSVPPRSILSVLQMNNWEQELCQASGRIGALPLAKRSSYDLRKGNCQNQEMTEGGGKQLRRRATAISRGLESQLVHFRPSTRLAKLWGQSEAHCIHNIVIRISC